MNGLALSLYQQGKYAEAEAMQRQTLQLQETVFGKDHPDTLISMNNLASSLRQQGKYAEAEKFYQQTLESRDKMLGIDPLGTLATMNNLAEVLRQQGEEREVHNLPQQKSHQTSQDDNFELADSSGLATHHSELSNESDHERNPSDRDIQSPKRVYSRSLGKANLEIRGLKRTKRN
jgi:tetratricopeptide (TPR) repeat protein